MAWGRLWIEVFAVRYYPDSCLVGWGKILENVAQDSHVFWSRFELGVTVTRSISFVNGSNIWFVFCTRQLFTDSILIIRVGNPESWETSFWAACDTSQCKFHVMFVCTKHSFPSGLNACPTRRKPWRRPQETRSSNDRIWSQLCTVISQNDNFYVGLNDTI